MRYISADIGKMEMETGYWSDICTPTFIAALFTIAKIWKQPKHQLANE